MPRTSHSARGTTPIYPAKNPPLFQLTHLPLGSVCTQIEGLAQPSMRYTYRIDRHVSFCTRRGAAAARAPGPPGPPGQFKFKFQT
eukprot:406318-Hanusia_phi.AAC.1